MKTVRRGMGDCRYEQTVYTIIRPKNWVDCFADSQDSDTLTAHTQLKVMRQWRESEDRSIIESDSTAICSRLFANNQIRKYFSSAVVGISPVVAVAKPSQSDHNHVPDTILAVPVITPMDSPEGVVPRAVYFGLPHAHTIITSVIDLPALPYCMRRTIAYKSFERYMSYNWEGIYGSEAIYSQKRLPLVSEDHAHEAVLLRFGQSSNCREHMFRCEPVNALLRSRVQVTAVVNGLLYYRLNGKTPLVTITNHGGAFNSPIFVDHIPSDECSSLYNPRRNESARQFMSVVFYPKEQSIVIPYSFQNEVIYYPFSIDFRSTEVDGEITPLSCPPHRSKRSQQGWFAPYLEKMLQIMRTEGWLKEPHSSKSLQHPEEAAYCNKITIGCDPEFELMVNDTIVNVRRELYNDAWNPSKTGIDVDPWKSNVAPHIKGVVMNSLNSGIGVDGAGSQIEMRPPAAETPQQLVENIRVLMKRVNDLGAGLTNHNVTVGLSTRGDTFPLGGHVHVGLKRTWKQHKGQPGDPEYLNTVSAYERLMWGKTHPMLTHYPVSLESMLESLGFANSSSDSPIDNKDRTVLVSLYDAYLGKHCTALHGEARGGYAVMGAYRTKKYGLEYRTLPAAVFNNPRIALIVCTIVKQLTEKYYGGDTISIPEDGRSLAKGMEELGISSDDIRYIMDIWEKGINVKLQQNVVAAWMRDTASSEAAETEDEPENVAHSDHIPAADPGDSTISETAEAPSNQAVTIVYRSEEHESTEGTEEMEESEEEQRTSSDESTADDRSSVYEWYERCTRIAEPSESSDDERRIDAIDIMWNDEWTRAASTALVQALFTWPSSAISRTYSLLRSLNPRLGLSVNFYGLHESRGETTIGVGARDLSVIDMMCLSHSPEGTTVIRDMLYAANVVRMDGGRLPAARNTQIRFNNNMGLQSVHTGIGISRSFRMSTMDVNTQAIYLEQIKRIMCILIAAKLYNSGMPPIP